MLIGRTTTFVSAAAAVLLAGAAAGAHAEGPPSRVVYLNFSDGTESLTHDGAGADDATRNRSELCGADRVGRWLGALDCGDREACKRAIVREVEALWAPFDVVFTPRRPAAGPYSMVVIGPPSGSCGFGVDGAASVDCGDRNPSNVAFAFVCAGTVSACARVVSHEVAHGFGLAHSDRSCDVMAADARACTEAAFHDEESRVHGTTCGGRTQNSYRTLLGLLGQRPGAAQPGEVVVGGCAAAGAPPRPAPASWLLVGGAVALRAIRRRQHDGRRRSGPLR